LTKKVTEEMLTAGGTEPTPSAGGQTGAGTVVEVGFEGVEVVVVETGLEAVVAVVETAMLPAQPVATATGNRIATRRDPIIRPLTGPRCLGTSYGLRRIPAATLRR
jgi:hypothetical protein